MKENPDAFELEKANVEIVNNFLKQKASTARKHFKRLMDLRSGNKADPSYSEKILNMQNWLRSLVPQIDEKLNLLKQQSSPNDLVFNIPMKQARIDLLAFRNAVIANSVYDRNSLQEKTLDEMSDFLKLIFERYS